MSPLSGKKLTYLRAQAYALRVNGFTVEEIAKKLKKSDRWVVKWSARSAENFEDKQRSGRPKVNKDAAIQVLNKAKYKRGNSTRQLARELERKILDGGKNSVWRYMKNQGWRALGRPKKPLLSTEQRTARLKFAKAFKHLTVEDWEDFQFSDECPKYLFQLPSPKNDIVWGSQEDKVPPAYQVKNSSKWMIWGGLTGHG